MGGRASVGASMVSEAELVGGMAVVDEAVSPFLLLFLDGFSEHSVQSCVKEGVQTMSDH